MTTVADDIVGRLLIAHGRKPETASAMQSSHGNVEIIGE